MNVSVGRSAQSMSRRICSSAISGALPRTGGSFNRLSVRQGLRTQGGSFARSFSSGRGQLQRCCAVALQGFKGPCRPSRPGLTALRLHRPINSCDHSRYAPQLHQKVPPKGCAKVSEGEIRAGRALKHQTEESPHPTNRLNRAALRLFTNSSTSFNWRLSRCETLYETLCETPATQTCQHPRPPSIAATRSIRK